MNRVKIANGEKKDKELEYIQPIFVKKKNMFNSMFALFTNKNLLFGGAGMASVHVITTLPTVDEQQKIAEIIIQIIIGIFTIIKIVKDKKNG
jgi:hypothetical protein